MSWRTLESQKEASIAPIEISPNFISILYIFFFFNQHHQLPPKVLQNPHLFFASTIFLRVFFHFLLVAHDVEEGLLLPREGRVRQILRRRRAAHCEGELLVAARDTLPLGLGGNVWRKWKRLKKESCGFHSYRFESQVQLVHDIVGWGNKSVNNPIDINWSNFQSFQSSPSVPPRSPPGKVCPWSYPWWPCRPECIGPSGWEQSFLRCFKRSRKRGFQMKYCMYIE